MIVLNKMHHSDEQWSALAKEPDDGPVFMINLFKFRDRANTQTVEKPNFLV